MTKTYSISDIVSGGYVGLRFGEPLIDMAQGKATGQDVVAEWAYRFGGIGPDGNMAFGGVIVTYVPPLIIQGIKKGLTRLMGKPIHIGPFRFP